MTGEPQLSTPAGVEPRWITSVLFRGGPAGINMTFD